MTYQEALRYLDSFVNFEKVDIYNYKASLKLERMKSFAALLGDPQKGTRSIHIAGTKGKGSTASYVWSILKHAGYRAGLYTSPHLISFRERIRIDSGLISEEDLARILTDIKKVIDSSMKDATPTFFEVCTALAYLYFKEKKVDFAVYETGLGGRLDATNLVEPLVSSLTPLSYEHTDKLGYTLKEIAAEKCGIIKDGGVCVSAPQEKDALEVIEDVCGRKRARLILVGRDITFKELRSGEDGEIFDVFGTAGQYPGLLCRLLGSHQVVNASLAIGIIESLRFHNIGISEEAIRKGIASARWDGRLEIVNRRPFVVVDGAQNRASARALAEAIKKIFRYKRLILVLGISKDKDVKGILDEILPISNSVILTKSRVVSRALEPLRIKETIDQMKSVGRDITLTADTEQALSRALSIAGADDLILVTGSLFIVGEAMTALNNNYEEARFK